MSVVRGSLFAMTIALLVQTGSSAGQSIPSPYRFIDEKQTVGAFASYILTARGTVGLGPEDGAAAGVRYSIRLSGPFNVEAETFYFPSTRPVRDTTLAGDEREQVGTADLTLLGGIASLRFNLTGPRTWHKLQPFVAFGVGAVLDLSGTSVEDERVPADVRFDFGTSFAAHVGGGIEWFPGNRLSLRLDARNQLWKTNTPFPFLVGEAGVQTPEDEWIQNGVISLGFAVRF
ncbi:MAG: hypothetical protein ACRENP_15905 [Longimicrobiales bacterium]